MICPKCNKEFSKLPAMSRRDQSEICSLCAHKEALEDAVAAGAMTKESAEGILLTLMATRK